MRSIPLSRWMSTRLHLALGLAAITVCAVLGASYIGLVPDSEALVRQHRSALAETIALATSMQLDETQPEALQQTLDFVRERNPDLLSVGVRAADGTLLVDLKQHAAHWSPGAHTSSSDSEIVVPVWQAGEPWGRLELRFRPLRAAGWRGHLQDPSLVLSGFMFVVCLFAFLLYLRRMLRELDPGRAIPPHVRAAYDGITSGAVVLDRRGLIVLANTAASRLLGVQAQRLVGDSLSNHTWFDAVDQPLARDVQPWAMALAL